MTYFDTAVIAVPSAKKDDYLMHAQEAAPLFKNEGALRVIEAWGDDVADGEKTSFPMAVKCEEGETVVVSFIEWPDKATRDVAMPKVMEAMQTKMTTPMPFDGSRMIFGGFDCISDE